jgi:hypothetical protein
MTKYHSRKTQVEGITFDSKKEAQRYCELRLLEKNGQISQLCRQVPFSLIPTELGADGKKLREIVYIADFVYTTQSDGVPQRHVEDVKGVKTDVYRLKKRLMWHLWGINVEEV